MSPDLHDELIQRERMIRSLLERLQTDKQPESCRSPVMSCHSPRESAGWRGGQEAATMRSKDRDTTPRMRGGTFIYEWVLADRPHRRHRRLHPLHVSPAPGLGGLRIIWLTATRRRR